MATIVYTSGTTGPPKGCMISHRNIASVLDSIHDLFQLDPKNNLSLMILPLSHLYPRVSSYYYNISMNIPFAVAESLDTLGQNMMEARPTFIASVPRVFEKVYARIASTAEKGSAFKSRVFQWAVDVGRQRSRKLNSHQSLSPLLRFKFNVADRLVFKKIRELLGGKLQFAVSAGAPLSAEVGEFMHSIGIQILEFYALTETISGTMTTFEHCRYGTVGKPMPGVEVKLAADGEILIRGNNFLGYYNKPVLTADTLMDGWICTGDVGRWDEDGFLVITDRKKDLIITSGGKNISPQNIENMFKSMPLASYVMVHGDRRNYLTALVTLNQAETEAYAQERGIPYSTYEELAQSPEIRDQVQKYMDRVNSKLARYETIKRFAILPKEFCQEEGEITPTLKLKRKAIREKYADLLTSLYEEA
jgi:long-chain acyl-CoA synthetase